MSHHYTDTPFDSMTEAMIHHFPNANSGKAEYLGFDCETSGLIPFPWQDDPFPGLMEIGMVAFDKNFQPIIGFSSPVVTPEAIHHRAYGLHPAAEKMHSTRRGNQPSLFEVVDSIDPSTYHAAAIEKRALSFILDNDLRGLPMLGSSITFDREILRAQMPHLLDAFHYQSVDATSYYLVVKKTLEKANAIYSGKETDHRVISDILDSADLVERALTVIQAG